jgi:8-oxo-dGTP diphosphatase
LYTYAHPHPAVAADICVFRHAEDAMSLLLIQRANPPFRGSWALPGGFLEPDEDLDQCAARELAEETGLTGLALHQFAVFSAPRRDPRERVISVAYLAIAPASSRTIAGSDAARARWHPLGALPSLAFDHAAIIAQATDTLRTSLRDPATARTLLPPDLSPADMHAMAQALVVPISMKP